MNKKHQYLIHNNKSKGQWQKDHKQYKVTKFMKYKNIIHLRRIKDKEK